MGVQVEITGEEKDGQVTFYTIRVQEGSRSWTVRKRYKEFAALNEDLIGTGLQRKDLPSKGFVGFRHQLNLGTFNETRRTELDDYLKALVTQIKALRDIVVIEQFLIYTDAASVVAVSRENSPEGRRKPSPLSEVRNRSKEAPRPEVVEQRTPSPESAKTTRSPEVEDSKKGYDQNAKGGVPPPAKQAAAPTTFEPLGVVVQTGPLEGPAWEDFRARHKELATTMESCSKMLSSLPRFENNCEDAFKDLRRHLRNLRSDASTLDSVPAKAMVWNFILLVAEKRAFYKGQVVEVAKILQTSEPWRNALDEKVELGDAKARVMGE